MFCKLRVLPQCSTDIWAIMSDFWFLGELWNSCTHCAHTLKHAEGHLWAVQMTAKMAVLTWLQSTPVVILVGTAFEEAAQRCTWVTARWAHLKSTADHTVKTEAATSRCFLLSVFFKYCCYVVGQITKKCLCWVKICKQPVFTSKQAVVLCTHIFMSSGSSFVLEISHNYHPEENWGLLHTR